MTSTTTRPAPTRATTSPADLALRVLGALLCLGVAYIHVKDQGGFPGDKDPEYLKVLYYVLEAAGVVAAVLLLAKAVRAGWLLALGVALGPIIGYCLSRGPGLPNATDDKGNWTEAIGVAALTCEALLLVVTLVARRRPAVR